MRSYRWLFWTLAIAGFTIDQASKYIVFQHFHEQLVPEGRQELGFELIPDAFSIVANFTGDKEEGTGVLPFLRSLGGDHLPYLNRGALWGLGNGPDGQNGNAIFAVISVIAAIVILAWNQRSKGSQDLFLTIALGLILGGTLGNLYDRVVFGGVRDFLHWYKWVNWAVFNIADCCLVVGASILCVHALFRSPVESPGEVPQAAVPQTAVVQEVP